MPASGVHFFPLCLQGLAEVLRDGECPAVITPSKPREYWGPHRIGRHWGVCRAGVIVSSAPTVVRRCFPAIHANKGVLMVGNETTYEDGHGTRKNITDLVEGAK